MKAKTQPKPAVTITVSVNIAGADKWEGDSQLQITIPEQDLPYLNTGKIDLAALIIQARRQYNEKNS